MKAALWRPVVAVFLTLSLPVQAQEFRPKDSRFPSADLEKSIQHALTWLKAVPPKAGVPTSRMDDTNELVFYTLLHGGVSPTDPVMGDYLKRLVDREPDRVYNSALAAMSLAKLDRVGYQWKLIHHAIFLQDNQCENGQWAYGSPVDLGPPVAVPGNATKGALYGSRNPAGYRPSDPKSTVAMKKIAVVQRSRVSKVGDNSNAQYAALGLRSCAEAGLVLDPRCLQDALHWWEGDQDRDGGWGYSRGEDDGSRATMTAGGVGSLVIYKWLTHKPWADDPHVRKGMEWIDANWKGRLPKWHVYFLYGLERVGMLHGTDRIGSKEWYDEGAGWLLEHQAANGSWSRSVPDTCFAILFLRRATAPLPGVATPGRAADVAAPEPPRKE